MGKDNKVAREEEKMQGIISMTGLIAYLVASIEKMKDPRQPSPNTTYSLKDAVLYLARSWIEIFAPKIPQCWGTLKPINRERFPQNLVG
jgi:hypothetical protein